VGLDLSRAGCYEALAGSDKAAIGGRSPRMAPVELLGTTASALGPENVGPLWGYVTYLNTQQARDSCAFKRLALGTSRLVGPSAGFVVRGLPSGGRDVQTVVRGTL
jgi:hypothetical protein